MGSYLEEEAVAGWGRWVAVGHGERKKKRPMK